MQLRIIRIRMPGVTAPPTGVPVMRLLVSAVFLALLTPAIANTAKAEDPTFALQGGLYLKLEG